MDSEAFAGLLTDLAAETAQVDSMLAGLPGAAWELPTPAAGWAVRDQVSHLAYFDQAATLAATRPDEFSEQAAQALVHGPGFADMIAEQHRRDDPAALLGWFRTARASLLTTFGELDPSTRVPWYGPPMSVASSATARLMETWAHGQDIADTLGIGREPTMRLRHIAHLGVRTFGFSFAIRGLEVPARPVRVELIAPDGSRWHWGPVQAQDLVTGPAEDFCLVVTQRRNLADTRLRVTGPAATQWMSVAQAFAGAPTTGRPAGSVGSPAGPMPRPAADQPRPAADEPA